MVALLDFQTPPLNPSPLLAASVPTPFQIGMRPPERKERTSGNLDPQNDGPALLKEPDKNVFTHVGFMKAGATSPDTCTESLPARDISGTCKLERKQPV